MKKQITVPDEELWENMASFFSGELHKMISSKTPIDVILLERLSGCSPETKKKIVRDIFNVEINKDFYSFVQKRNPYPIRPMSFFVLDPFVQNKRFVVPKFMKEKIFLPLDKNLIPGKELIVEISYHKTSRPMKVKELDLVVNNFLEEKGVKNLSFLLPVYLSSVSISNSFLYLIKNQKKEVYLLLYTLPRRGKNSSRSILSIRYDQNKNKMVIDSHDDGWKIPPLSTFFLLTDLCLFKHELPKFEFDKIGTDNS